MVQPLTSCAMSLYKSTLDSLKFSLFTGSVVATLLLLSIGTYLAFNHNLHNSWCEHVNFSKSNATHSTPNISNRSSITWSGVPISTTSVPSIDKNVSQKEKHTYDPYESWIYGSKFSTIVEKRTELENTFMFDLKEALKPQNRNITVIITGCNRLDLLSRTITAFEKYNAGLNKNYSIIQRIMIDDCKNKEVAKKIVDAYVPKYYLIFSGESDLEKTQENHKDDRISRVIDITHNVVQTPWIISMEDDWEFKKPGFIESVFDIYQSYVENYEKLNTQPDVNKIPTGQDTLPRAIWKSSKVICRVDDKKHADKVAQDYKNTNWKYSNWEFKNEEATWGGITYNAGMMPTFIWKKWIGPLEGSKHSHLERTTSKRLIQLGFHYASMTSPYCVHIGQGRHEYQTFDPL